MSEQNPAAKYSMATPRLVRAQSQYPAQVRKLLENSLCSISVEECVPCLSLTWKRYATSEQLRLILDDVILMLKEHRLSRILGDDKAVSMVHASDQEWVVSDWYPRAIAAGWRASATRVPAEHFGHLVTSKMQSKVPAPVVIRTFNELDKARQWLREFTPR